MKKLKVDVDGKKYDVSVEELEDGKLSIELENKKYTVKAEEESDGEDVRKAKAKSSGSSSKNISAPIPGTVGKINVKEGKSISNGDVLLTLIAMKMENEIKANVDGKVKSIKVKVGQNVDVGEELIELE